MTNPENGIQSSVWGPPLWFFLHTMSLNYPLKPTIKDKEHYYNFMLGLQYVIPCGICRQNFVQNIDKLAFSKKHLRSRSTFSKFMVDLHNLVNRETGKKKIPYTKAISYYEIFRAGNAKKKCSLVIYNQE
jgi:hypothetical protein